MIIIKKLQILLILSLCSAGISKKIINSDSKNLTIKINIDALTEADLAKTNILVGLPSNHRPTINIEKTNPSGLSFDSKQLKQEELEEFQIQKLQGKKLEKIR